MLRTRSSTGLIENRKAAVRCKAEHPFRFLKVQCGFRKTVYRGLKKDLSRVLVPFASSSLRSWAKAGRKLAVDWLEYGSSLLFDGISQRNPVKPGLIRRLEPHFGSLNHHGGFQTLLISSSLSLRAWDLFPGCFILPLLWHDE